MRRLIVTMIARNSFWGAVRTIASLAARDAQSTAAESITVAFYCFLAVSGSRTLHNSSHRRGALKRLFATTWTNGLLNVNCLRHLLSPSTRDEVKRQCVGALKTKEQKKQDWNLEDHFSGKCSTGKCVPAFSPRNLVFHMPVLHFQSTRTRFVTTTTKRCERISMKFSEYGKIQRMNY